MDCKPCTRCGVVKPLDMFPANKKMKSGRDSLCRACYAAKAREYRARNPEKVKASQRAHYAANKEKRDEHVKKWAAKNLDRRREHRKKWRAENHEQARACEKASYAKHRDKALARKKDYRAANTAKWTHYANQRRAARLQATPAWADLKAIEAVYQECAETTVTTGVEHHVDHIVPLKHPLVCGLHVHWNLRVIPGLENRQKANKLIVFCGSVQPT